MTPELIVPEWPAPAHVRAVSTLRTGGVSRGPYESFNLAAHVGDDPQQVTENRRRLRELLGVPVEPMWLSQVHGNRVVDAADSAPERVADGIVASAPHQVCVILTADCLPVLFTSRDGCKVGAAHAGWRGLAAGVLEAVVRRLEVPPAELMAWLGPTIERAHFEVGDEVREAFLRNGSEAAGAFVPHGPGKWLADLVLLARQRLARAGVTAVFGGEWGTYGDSARFFSYRRDGRCGRMAALIWREA